MFQGEKPPLKNDSTNISLLAPLGLLPPSWAANQTAKSTSSTEVLSTSVCSEIEKPSRDGNADTSHSYHLEVRPPKGYDHSTRQIRKDLNMTQSFLLRSTCNYISLRFIISLHLINGIHAIIYILCLLFEKEIQKIREPILPPFPDLWYKNNKDYFIGRDLSEAIFHPRQCHGSWVGIYMRW